MKKTTFFVTAFVTFSSILQAADSLPERPSLPGGTLPVRTSDFANWQITYTYDLPPASPPAQAQSAPAALPAPLPPVPMQIKQVLVSKTGKIYHREEIIDNGRGLDQWWVSGVQLTGKKGGPYLFSNGNDGSIYQIDYQLSDFPELNWIGADCYTGVESIRGIKCFVFKKQISLQSRAILDRLPPDERMATLRNKVEATAWLDLQTSLPVQLSIPGRLATYQFYSAPTAVLALPPEVALQIKSWQDQSAPLSRPRISP